MKPKHQEKSPEIDLFRTRLDNIINMRHELVKLSEAVDWDFLAIVPDRYTDAQL